MTDEASYPKSLPANVHTKTCIRCNKSYSGIQKGFNKQKPFTKPLEYHTVCIVCEHNEKELPDFRKAVDKHAYQKLFRAEVKKAAKAAADARAKRVRETNKIINRKVLAQKEVARRELGRRRLVNFIIRFNPGYKAGWVHKLICAKLEFFSNAVTLEMGPRMLFFMPPRLGKSEIASKNFPAWHLGHNPSHEIIAASYAQSLPMQFSRKIKNLIQEDAYKAMFPETRLDPNAQATEGWYTTKGGCYIPAGVGLGISGKGAHVLVIDDPIKDMQEADSDVVRQTVWDWWDSTAETRVAPGGGVLGIQTRWNDDDWSGRLLSQEADALREIEDQRNELLELIGMTKDEMRREDLRYQLKEVDDSVADVVRWDVLSLPALAEQNEFVDEQGNLYYEPTTGAKQVRKQGQALHPERYDENFFRRKRKSSQPRIWSALFQQNPVPESGVYFTTDMFRYEPVVANYSSWNVYAAWDLAIGQKHTNDWTVGVIGAHDFDDRIHILNVVRVRTKDIAGVVFGTCKAYKQQLQLVGLEQGQIQMSIMPNLEKLMSEDRWYFSLDETLKPVTDKMARARPAQAWMQQGRILLPANQPWVEPFKHELLRFPGGTYDDQVDALAWLVRMIAHQAAPRRPDHNVRKQSWRDQIRANTTSEGHLAA